MNPASRRPARRLRAALGKVVVLLATVEVVSYAGLFLVAPHLNLQTTRLARLYHSQTLSLRRLAEDPTTILCYDESLGWKPRPGASSLTDTINSQGLRSHREYERVAPPGTQRIAVFGDSLVYCTEVPDEQAWPRVLERRDPAVEILNYGVPAYGPDQAYLRFTREGTALSPHATLLCLTMVSLDRLVNVYRPFLTRSEDSGFWVKPRYVLREGGLELLPDPFHLEEVRQYLDHPELVRRFGVHDYWYDAWIYENPLYDYSAAVRLGTSLWSKLERRYLDPDRPLLGPPDAGQFNPDSSAFKILLELVGAFRTASREHGARPLVVILPDRFTLERLRAGKPPMHAPLVQRLAADGIAFVDAAEAFPVHAGADLNAWFMPFGHYSAAANQLLAEWLRGRLQDLDFLR